MLVSGSVLLKTVKAESMVCIVYSNHCCGVVVSTTVVGVSLRECVYLSLISTGWLVSLVSCND